MLSGPAASMTDGFTGGGALFVFSELLLLAVRWLEALLFVAAVGFPSVSEAAELSGLLFVVVLVAVVWAGVAAGAVGSV